MLTPGLLGELPEGLDGDLAIVAEAEGVDGQAPAAGGGDRGSGRVASPAVGVLAVGQGQDRATAGLLGEELRALGDGVVIPGRARCGSSASTASRTRSPSVVNGQISSTSELNATTATREPSGMPSG